MEKTPGLALINLIYLKFFVHLSIRTPFLSDNNFQQDLLSQWSVFVTGKVQNFGWTPEVGYKI